MYFLKKVGIVEGHRLSPFATRIETPDQLLKLLLRYFEAQPSDTQGIGVADATLGEDADNAIDYDDECVGHGSCHCDGYGEMTSPESATVFITNIANAEKEDDEVVLGDDQSPTEASDTTTVSHEAPSDENETSFYDKADATKWVKEFKTIIGSSDFDDISQSALKLMELLHVGNIKRGLCLWLVSKHHCRFIWT